MRGLDLSNLRKELGYSQAELMQELGVASRQTISSWEQPDRKVPRLVELAMIALREVPDCRCVLGEKKTAKERRKYFSG